MIDQRRLPGQLIFVTCTNCSEISDAIRNMTIRGAPAIGVAAAFGLALTAVSTKSHQILELQKELATDAEILSQTRPTAINLNWALRRMMNIVNSQHEDLHSLQNSIVGEANKIAEEDVATNLKMAQYGAKLINDGDTIIHHCNTGSLAAVDWGTALGCIRLAHEQGKHVNVLVDETRPRLQGSRLTAWELEQYGIPYEIIVDGAAGGFLRSRIVSKVMFGADRVAANGDVANKTGTYMLALAAHENHVPVISVFPSTSVDLSISNGDLIPIEERDPGEVLNIEIKGERATPKNAKALNPAFDITPNLYISIMVTEKGLIKPPYSVSLPRIISGSKEEQL